MSGEEKRTGSWIDKFCTEEADALRHARDLHMIYVSYLNAGFNKEQAFDLTKLVLIAAFGQNGGAKK